MHLRREHQTWFFRRRVPQDLQAKLGKREIYKSLATSCRRTAQRRAALLFVASEELFDVARDEDLDLTPDELAAIARHWLDGKVKLKQEIDRLPPGKLARFGASDPWAGYRPMLPFPVSPDDIHAARARHRDSYLQMVLASAGYEATPERVEAVAPALKQAVEDYAEARRQQVFHPDQVTAAGGGEMPRQKDSPKVSALLGDWAEQAIDEGRWSEHTKAQNLRSLDLLIRICGDRPLNSYVRADAQTLRRTLEQIPKNWGKSSRYFEAPILEVIANKPPDMETLSVSTLDRHWHTITGFFRWANREDGVVPVDIDRIFGGFQWSPNAPEAQDREPWDDASLAKLFSSPAWTGFEPHPRKPHRRHRPGDAIKRDHHFWLPILALYTGARLEELGQLHRGDVQKVQGIHVIRITDEGPGQRLKTKSSKRMVPLHSELIRLGFLDHVDALSGRDPTDRIFPEIERGGRANSLSHFYTEQFTEYRRKIGVYRELMDFHSFRHNATTTMMRKDVRDLTVDQLTGHDSDARRERGRKARRKQGSSVSLRYFAGFTMPQLQKAIETISYPSIDLSRHYVSAEVIQMNERADGRSRTAR